MSSPESPGTSAVTTTLQMALWMSPLSLIPALYLEGFEEVEADGTVAVGALVRGRPGGDDSVAVQAFAVNVDVADGSFRYPDLPLPARGIALRLSASNPGGDADLTVVDVTPPVLSGAPVLAEAQKRRNQPASASAVRPSARISSAPPGRASWLRSRAVAPQPQRP